MELLKDFGPENLSISEREKARIQLIEIEWDVMRTRVVRDFVRDGDVGITKR